MERLTYLLDTNAVADYINDYPTTRDHIDHVLLAGTTVYLCQPVYFEVMRGLLKINALRKLRIFQEELTPQLGWLPIEDGDWLQAAHYWAVSTSQGYQLSDVDLLIAALAVRLNAVIVSDDSDFDTLPVLRENWRPAT